MSADLKDGGPKHSPLPWEVLGVKVSDGAIVTVDGAVVDATGDVVAMTHDLRCAECNPYFGEYDANAEEANTELIVRAVNSHADLLAALKAIDEGVRHRQETCPVCAEVGVVAWPHTNDCQLVAAIAKAEGVTHG